MSLSVSRGAWLALFAGLVVVIVMSAHRGSLLVAGAIVGIAAVTAITRLHAYPALTDDPLVKPGQLTAGHRYAAQLLVIVGVATAAQSVVAAGRASTLLMRRVDRLVRPLAIGAAVVVAVVLAAGYAWKAADAEGEASKRLHSASAWVSRQWRDFMRPAALTDTGSARLSSSKGTRSDLYRVAIDGFEAHPLRGDGAGGFPVRWFRTRDVGETVRNAHSLEFETLGELGIIGVLLLCAFLGSIGAAILLARMHAGGLAGSQVAAVAGAFTVWLVHSFVDWDWQVTALTGIVLVLAASAFPYGRGVRRRESPRSFELMEDVRAESSR
jgi:O-antigen ligase